MMQNRDGAWGRSAPTEREAATREVDQSVRRLQLAGIDPPAGLKYSDAKFALVNPHTGSLHGRQGTSRFATAVQAGSRARPRLAARRPPAGCVPSRGGARLMELRWLQDFLTVAETSNFTRAAERRNTSQAAFSRRIKSLESWLGFDLIDRSVYPTQLTPQGERFREHASDLLRQMLDTRTELGGKPLHRHEHIRIALPFAMATARLPSWWPAWSQDRRLSCSVVVGNIHDLVTSLVRQCGPDDLLPPRPTADPSRSGSLRMCDALHRIPAALCQRSAGGQGRRVAAWTGVASGAAFDVFARRLFCPAGGSYCGYCPLYPCHEGSSPF